MTFSVMKIDRPNEPETTVFKANDRWGALYLGVYLLNVEPEPAMFWVAGPDGYKVDDPKAISDFADKNGYPNAWRTRDPRRQF